MSKVDNHAAHLALDVGTATFWAFCVTQIAAGFKYSFFPNVGLALLAMLGIAHAAYRFHVLMRA